MARTLRDAIVALFLTLVFAAMLKSCVIDAFKIPSASMVPVLRPGDFLLVNKFILGARTPEKFLYLPLPHFRFPALRSVHRGDVLVFEFPGEPNEAIMVRNLVLVKRCVGLPADTVSVRDGRVTVNGASTDFFPHADEESGPFIVPYRGMPVPLDSISVNHWRVFIRREGHTAEFAAGTARIDGKEAASYTVEKNYYFFIGDNINDSSDSRAWGPVAEEHLLGTAMLIYWSHDDKTGIRWERIGHLVH